MIVKYLSNGVWGYIDNVRQATSKFIDCDALVKEYNNSTDFRDDTRSGEKDIASYADGKKLPEDVAYTNKVFIIATKDAKDWGHETHVENLIDYDLAQQGIYATVILLYVEEHKEYDSVALVTNQKCFLMNDKGQTIERLV